MEKAKVLGNPFRALKSAPFAFYASGVVFSLFGTFMQLHVFRTFGYSLSGNSEVFLGYIAALSSIPSVFLLLPGNLVAMRFEKRRILMVMAVLASLPPLWLTYQSSTGHLNAGMLLTASLFLGLLIPFENPSRYPLVAGTVPKSDIGTAFALCQWFVFIAKASGPLVGAIALVTVGATWCFAINALTYIGEAISLLFVPDSRPTSGANLEAFRRLPGFLFKDKENRSVCVMVAITCLFGVQVQLSPLLAQAIDHSQTTVALLVTSAEVGTVVGGFLVASLRTAGYQRVISASVVAMGGSVLAVSLSTWLPLSMIAMAGIGFCQGVIVSASSSFLQSRVSDALRGPLGSTFFTGFFTIAGVGSLLMSGLSSVLGAQNTFALAGIILIISVIPRSRSRVNL